MNKKVLLALTLFLILIFGIDGNVNKIPVNYINNQNIITRVSDVTIEVLYIYNSSDTEYNSFSGYNDLFLSTSRINLHGVDILDFVDNPSIASPCHAIIVGHSAFGHYPTYNTTRSNLIVNQNKPIIAFGRGGGTFFQGLGIGYGGGTMGWTNSGLTVNASDASHGIFKQTYEFEVPGNISTTSGNRFVYGLYMGITFPDTEYLATDDDTYLSHAPLAEYSGFSHRSIYYGYLFPPTDVNSNRYKLLHNIIEWVANPPIIELEISSPLNGSTVSGIVPIDVNYESTEIISSLYLYINGVYHSSIGCSNTEGSVSFTLNISDPTYAEDSFHTIEIDAIDENGWKNSVGITVFKDEFPETTTEEPTTTEEITTEEPTTEEPTTTEEITTEVTSTEEPTTTEEITTEEPTTEEPTTTEEITTEEPTTEEPTTTEEITTEEPTTEEESTSVDEIGTTSEEDTESILITPGFSGIVFLFGFLLIIPLKLKKRE